jgi:hypothetical protein
VATGASLRRLFATNSSVTAGKFYDSVDREGTSENIWRRVHSALEAILLADTNVERTLNTTLAIAKGVVA